ncbi:MAG: hypothetical protein IJ593_03030 [Lachnospiraceae bacterium]|nr:hypothetical protein [Lachnospiraceae bacterium]
MKISRKELDNLKYYIDERKRLLKEIDNYLSMLSDGYKSQDFTTLIPAHGKSNYDNATLKIIMHNEKIQNEIKKRVRKVENIIIKLYKFINKIDNLELKTIVELRAIKGLTWEQIGEEMHIDTSGARKKYIAFIDS